ncbi:MAG: M14 family zinc carboxypeptidase [Phycisphaerales bacterium]
MHGDETSASADAAIAVAYHLIASRDDEVRDMLNNLLIIIDPMMNPDGRDRFLKMVREHRGNVPNVDDQSLLHTGYWPAGRTNHYMFDLNRDWIFGVHPETRGRIKAVGEWNPVLFVDAHEMGAQDTYLFSPSRDPINPNMPDSRSRWNALFARDQAAAFDANGWRYYTGEWNEGWYPGYSDNWAAFRGAIGVLYEQAGVAQDGVLRPEGTVLTYKRAVRQQAVSSIANLRTLLQNKSDLMRDYAAERRDAIAGKRDEYKTRAWAVIPDANNARTRRFTDLMQLQGFDIGLASSSFRASGTDVFGRNIDNREFPAGTLIVRNAQPEAHLIATMLEFDRRMSDEYLASERKEILNKGRTRIYDVTAWNIPMMFGLDAYELTAGAPARLDQVEAPASRSAPIGTADVAWVVDGADDDTATLAAQLMERGVEVRIATKPVTWADHSFSRGSVVVTIDDNRQFSGDSRQSVQDTSRARALDAIAVNTGLGEGDLPTSEVRTSCPRPPTRRAGLLATHRNSYDA